MVLLCINIWVLTSGVPDFLVDTSNVCVYIPNIYYVEQAKQRSASGVCDKRFPVVARSARLPPDSLCLPSAVHVQCALSVHMAQFQVAE